MRRLYTTDTKALNHILMNTDIYQKPETARYNLTRVLGAGSSAPSRFYDSSCITMLVQAS